MSKTAVSTLIDIDDYLRGEQQSPIRHEYLAGQVYAMVGGTRAHNRIAGNIFAFLHRHLRDGPCSVHISDVKVWIEAAQAFYYPDVVVSCEPFDPKALYLTAPCLVIEVLSPSTETIDRREKLLCYRQLPSLKEYLLVGSETVELVLYRRVSDGWEMTSYGVEDGQIPLVSVQAELSLAEVYAGVFEDRIAGT